MLIQVLTPPISDGSILLGKRQQGEIVVANQSVIQSIFRDHCLHSTHLVRRRNYSVFSSSHRGSNLKLV